MRIVSFTKEWPKLKQSVFTTFRYPRQDRDWEVGEVVQIFFQSRSLQRRKLGEAMIIKKERRELEACSTFDPLLTEAEAIEDGFESREDMVRFMRRQYGLDYIGLFTKLTLRWEKHE